MPKEMKTKSWEMTEREEIIDEKGWTVSHLGKVFRGKTIRIAVVP